MPIATTRRTLTTTTTDIGLVIRMAPDDRFMWVRFDKATSMRPQHAAAKEATTSAQLDWLKAHPDYQAPRALRIGGKRSGVALECLRVLDALSQGVPKSQIKATLWPHLDSDGQRERLRHRMRRGRELVAAGWDIRRLLISPSTLPVNRIYGSK